MADDPPVDPGASWGFDPGEQRPFFEVTDEIDLVLDEANRTYPKARPPLQLANLARTFERGTRRHLRTVELPAGPGHAISSSRRLFDGTTVYVQLEDLRHDDLTLDRRP